MAQREKGGRVVFIGNIPYGVSEEQICELFGRAGTVVSFRLVYDKETGRPKGFGFLEYTDVDAAASAVRNMNDFDIMGRTLRVDYSNDNGGGKGGGAPGGHSDGEGGRAPPPPHFTMGNAPSQQQPMNGGGGDPSALPSLPPGVDLPNGLSAPDAISKTLSTLPAPQLLDILSQVKSLATGNPAQASALLAQAPQLGYAIFQALLLLGLVDTSVLGSLIQTSAAQPPPQQQQQQQAPPMQMSMPAYPPQNQQHQAPAMPMSMPPQHQQQQQYTPYNAPPPQSQQPYPPHPHQQQNYAPTPPVQQPPYQPPPQQQQQVQMPPDPAQAALIQQVLAMSREQIMGLDEGPRGQILALRASFGAPVV
ncbi:hypothetical protein LTR08_001240 [Meristemomyces frigidus]|nr:hypothetical protein LTR08_001240 [Meristemomyces frigidus]